MPARSRFADHRPHLIAFARRNQAKADADAARYEIDGMPRPSDVAHIHRLIAERGWTELLDPQPSVLAGELHVVEMNHVAVHTVVEAQ
ncbi:MAG: hypothetical protein QOH21_2627 [Acidobacteriota bacterium]|jgi:hypothetical protein|nr:hypothetical protein [Acidobacteriota bacterium]